MSDILEDFGQPQVISEFVGERAAELATQYEQVRFLPSSIYDQQQEALFRIGLAAEDLTDFEVSELVMSKAIFELQRNGRGSLMDWLTNSVSDFTHRTELLDKALELDNDASLTVVLALGDLRAEAQASGNTHNMLEYLMVEFKHGMNLFANAEAIRVLLDDPYCQKMIAGVPIHNWKRDSDASSFDRLLTERIMTLIDQGDTEHAELLSKYVGTELARTIAERIEIRSGAVERANYYKENQVKPNRKMRNDYMAVRSKGNQCLQGISSYDKPKAGECVSKGIDLAWMLLRSPQLAYSPQDVVTAYELLARSKSMEGVFDYRGRLQAEVLQAGLLEAFPDILEEESTTTPTAKLERDYSELLEKGITGKTVIMLFRSATELCLREEESANQSENQYTSVLSDLELLIAEWSSERPHIMSDAVDQSRHRQKYNRAIAALDERIEAFPYASQKFLLRAELLSFQMTHDCTQNGQFTDLRQKLVDNALVCLDNSVVNLTLSNDDIYEACKKYGINLDLAVEEQKSSTPNVRPFRV